MKRVLLLLVVCAIATIAGATTVVFVSNEEAVRKSELILMGRVLGVETLYDREGQIVREIRVAVDETLKGQVDKNRDFVFRAFGGVKEGVRDHAIGEANYKVGEKVLLHLEKLDDGYHTLGLSFGKWTVEKGVLKRDLRELTGARTGPAPVPTSMRLQEMRDLVVRVEREKVAR